MSIDMISVKKQLATDKVTKGAEQKFIDQFDLDISCKKKILHACEAFLVHFTMCNQVGLQLFKITKHVKLNILSAML